MSEHDSRDREWEWSDFYAREIQPHGLDVVTINNYHNLPGSASMINESVGMKFDQGWYKGTVISRCSKQEEKAARANGILGANFNTEFCNTVISLQLSRERLLFHFFFFTFYTEPKYNHCSSLFIY